jgi:hypothetical protein
MKRFPSGSANGAMWQTALTGLRQPERVAVPRGRALHVGYGDGDEVDVLDLH